MLRRRIQALGEEYISGPTLPLAPLLGGMEQSPSQFTLLLQNRWNGDLISGEGLT